MYIQKCTHSNAAEGGTDERFNMIMCKFVLWKLNLNEQIFTLKQKPLYCVDEFNRFVCIIASFYSTHSSNC